MMEEIYSDILDKQVVTFPIRFDFDGREDVYKKIDHPKSHLTLGQYRNCRIPVSSPISPYKFIDFIIRNFYNTAYKRYCEYLTNFSIKFEETIHPDEKKMIFIDV